ncbi:outer membrane lipoprotein LolB [Pseudoalteromonas piscicida]|uniref:Outer-membrane lipoprotein LolB n=1 Tax=Pseudoalteromonas piscicida TaxID=43662 RepID=A0AAD0RGS2_PSEO7|nr:outer membrane lipoprotein LolB [Pseudoalteromonas piscicida]AXQ98833.1 outer membrane lipoprotein LolB [Pseudoalteromonas piscicida]AXR01393.1 outer membrane lipoprotein LolB [Pseudoalteromonas piscicida]
MPVLLEPCFKAGNFIKNQSNMESKERPLRQLHLILLIFLLILTGCAQQLPQQNVAQDWQSTLKQQKNWQARGKLAFIAPDNRQSANFNWYLKEDKQNLILTSFVGTRIFELEELDTHSELTFEDNVHKGMDSSDLVKRLSGLSLPVNQAPQWLTGLVEAPASELDDLGRIRNAQWQSPSGRVWQITYQQYKMQDGMWLPSRMKLSSTNIEVKVLITSWQFK